jgi:arylsulfatase A
MKRNILPVILMLFLFLFSFSSESKNKPNIIFFIADDMLPEHFNCLNEGKDKYFTPNLDRLAREGTIMLEQHVVSPVCTPSRYSVLTGMYPSRATSWGFLDRTKKEGQTVVHFNTEINKDTVNVGSLLKDNGYTTGFVGKNHVIHAHDLVKFPNYDASAKDPRIKNQLISNHEKIKNAIKEAGFSFADRIYHNNPPYIGLKEVGVHNMDWITEGAINFINENKSNPFFLYFATTIPHGPTEAKRAWNANPSISAVGYLDNIPDVLPPRKTIPERLIKEGFSTDFSRCNLLWLDDTLGALIKKLEDEKILDNTIIFFFSDHGQEAKGTLYQGGVHDPSIVWKSGGLPVGKKSNALISNIDFTPTILDIAGVDYNPALFDGQSFKPQLLGKKPKERTLYFELGYARAIRMGKWKYMAIRYPDFINNWTLEDKKKVLDEYNAERRRKYLNIVTEDPSEPFSHFNAQPGGGDAERVSTGKKPAYYDSDQLYNLEKDPNELNNLAGDKAFKEKLQEMKNELKLILDTLPGDFPL